MIDLEKYNLFLSFHEYSILCCSKDWLSKMNLVFSGMAFSFISWKLCSIAWFCISSMSWSDWIVWEIDVLVRFVASYLLLSVSESGSHCLSCCRNLKWKGLWNTIAANWEARQWVHNYLPRFIIVATGQWVTCNILPPNTSTEQVLQNIFVPN